MHRRFFLALLAAFALILTTLASTGVSADPKTGDDLADDPLTAYLEKNGLGGSNGNGGKTGQVQNNGAIRNMEVVGHNDFNDRGFNADVYGYKGYAYVGQWGFGISNFPKFCPSGDKSGVKVVDLSQPSLPTVATLQNPPGTSAEDIVVFTPSYGPKAGRDIAAVGIQACFRRDDATFRGLQLFDVTDASNPVELGRLSSGLKIRGVHELSVAQRPDLGKVLALEAVNYSQTYDAGHRGDLRIVDITDPVHPVETGNWALASVGVTNQFTGVGCFARTYGHAVSASADGRTAYLSAIDGGEILVNISDPANPTFLRNARYPASEAGDMDTHSADVSLDSRWLYVQDEDECRSNDSKNQVGWGYLRVFDTSSRDANGDLVETATFKTPHSAANNDPSNGEYTIHHVSQNAHWSTAKIAISWYSDGVRIVDVSGLARGRAPVETAFFVPPAYNDPVGSCACLGNSAFVWGVHVMDDGTILLSDINSGLWVIREKR